MATEPDGAPLLLLSRLALHTQNIEADPRASLLIEAGIGHGDPLAGGRVTVTGRVQPAASSTAGRRFLAVHPAAAGYAGFADFSLFVLHLERAHFVGGFGRIFSLDRNDVLVDASGAGDLISAEPELLEKVNRDEVVHIARLGERLSGGRAGRWQVTGLDPAGCDLALADERLRCDFTEPATTAEKALRAMRQLFQQA